MSRRGLRSRATVRSVRPRRDDTYRNLFVLFVNSALMKLCKKANYFYQTDQDWF
mgnify:CR=1